jgi:uncharacterized protein (TIGR00266 family)
LEPKLKVEILYKSTSAVAKVSLEKGEKIQAEAGSMGAMTPNLAMETNAEGGLIKSLSRSMLGGESFFLNTYTANEKGAFVFLAPPMPGDISVIKMNNQSLLVQSGSYMASSAGIEIETLWEGAKNFFAGEGLVMLEISGTGTILISSFGAIHHIPLKEDESIVIDTGHLVAFDPEIHYQIKRVAGWKSTLFSGEGLVVELTGPGELYMQSRVQSAFFASLLATTPDMLLKMINRNG